jgi:hypothetical protein
MSTFDINKLAFHYATALQNNQEAKVKEEADFYPIELTLERVEGEGFLQGLEFGALAGFRHAIALLQSEQFTEHAHILSDQLKNVEAIFETGE